MSGKYAALQRRLRLQKAPILREAWMAGDGFVYAQPPVCAYPGVLRALLYLSAVGVAMAVLYLAWLGHSLLWGTSRSTSPPRRA